MEKNTAELPDQLDGFQPQASGIIKFEDGEAYFVESIWQSENLGQIRCLNFYFVKKRLEAYILCYAPESEFAELESTFRDIATSFRFTTYPSQ